MQLCYMYIVCIIQSPQTASSPVLTTEVNSYHNLIAQNKNLEVTLASLSHSKSNLSGNTCKLNLRIRHQIYPLLFPPLHLSSKPPSHLTHTRVRAPGQAPSFHTCPSVCSTLQPQEHLYNVNGILSPSQLCHGFHYGQSKYHQSFSMVQTNKMMSYAKETQELTQLPVTTLGTS